MKTAKSKKPLVNKTAQVGHRAKPNLEQTGEPEGKVDPLVRSQLGIYLRMNSISTSAFSRALGVAYPTVMEWVNGHTIPSLAGAWWIEYHTKGAVPMESWMRLPAAVQQLSKWREHQPEDMREAATMPAVEAGGASFGSYGKKEKDILDE